MRCLMRPLPSLPSLLSFLLLLAACSGGALEPVPVDTRNDTCAWCRMTVSDARTASELLAPHEEPKIFDDIGCLRDYLGANPRQTAGSAAFVADHRTGAWVAAERAVYTRVPGLDTAMGSHLLAHADAASRAADPAARGGEPLGVADVFGPGVLPVREPHRP
jgi:copper chaperone NosL